MSLPRRRRVAAFLGCCAVLCGCIAASHREVVPPSPPPIRWEYAARLHCPSSAGPGDVLREIETAAGAMGEQGWELIDLAPAAGGGQSGCFVVLFKRPKP